MSEIQPTQLQQAQPRSAPPRGRGTGRVTVERAQLAKDAAGRVELLVLHPPADALAPADSPPALPRAERRAMLSLMRSEGWFAVAVMAAVLAVVFVIGLWFTH